MAYEIKIGVWKSIKNVLIVWGVPALILLVGEWQNWVPADYHRITAPIIGLISYFIKNWIQNK